MSHSFTSDFSAIPEKERDLQKVKNDFSDGALQAFRGACDFQKLEKVRAQQEALAVKHLKFDATRTGSLSEDPNSLEKFSEIMTDLDVLSSEIKRLHQS
eukprot:sb/3478641/